MRGDHILDKHPKIFLLDIIGSLLFELEFSSPRYKGNCIKLSINNQFLLTLGSKDYSVFNMLKECPVDINGMQTIPYWNQEVEYGQFVPFVVTIPTSDLMTISNDITNNYIILAKLTTNEIKTIESSMRVIASSPSGRYVYFLDNEHQLYVSNYPFDKELSFKPLLDHVQKVIPSYSDNYIYVISDDYTIILYDVSAKEVKQKAYRGKTYFQASCAKGLYVVNDRGEVTLFKPNDELKVNTPAITTFVKRWNLKTKKQESPSAMCPICAKQIVISHYIKQHLIDSPLFVKHSDWDNPELYGHLCPHCNAELQFTPYIV
jgi:WD40 repeat protein